MVGEHWQELGDWVSYDFMESIVISAFGMANLNGHLLCLHCEEELIDVNMKGMKLEDVKSFMQYSI